MKSVEFNQPVNEGVNDPNIFKAVFMAGPPGAGKNTVIKDLGLEAKGLKLMDVDHVVSLLQHSHDDAGYQRGADAIQRRASLFQSQMLGMIINTTGRDYEATMRLNHQLQAAGYDTFMVFVEVDQDTAWQRAQDRQRNATDPANQRPVTKDYFDQAYPQTMMNRDFYAASFGNNFANVTNNEQRVVEDDGQETYAMTLRRAAQKVRRFLRGPLNATAQAAVAQARAR